MKDDKMGFWFDRWKAIATLIGVLITLLGSAAGSGFTVAMVDKRMSLAENRIGIIETWVTDHQRITDKYLDVIISNNQSLMDLKNEVTRIRQTIDRMVG